MIPARVAYTRPSTVEEAIDLLADPDAKILAGGHSLVPMMKLRLARPSLLVDIGRLPLSGVSRENGHIEIGALTTYDALGERHCVPDALWEAAASVGDVQVRNRGTLGGGIAHADPATDCAAGLIALDATLRLRSAEGLRECAAEDFFLSPFTTVLGGREILESVLLTSPSSGGGSAYYATSDAASGYPLAGAAVSVILDGDAVARVRVGLTGATPAPCRLPAAEEALLGPVPIEGVRRVAAGVRLNHGGGDERHRRQLVAVAILRAHEMACVRARGEERP